MIKHDITKTNIAIERLLETRAPEPAEVEYALTEGYAHALGLEREALALERQMADLAAAPDELMATRELRGLFPRRRALDGQLHELRTQLRTLKLHAESSGVLGAKS